MKTIGRFIHFILVVVCALTLSLGISVATASYAYAANNTTNKSQTKNENTEQHYMTLTNAHDTAQDIADSPTKNPGEDGLTDDLISVSQTIINTLIMPIALLITFWSQVYVAAFPILIGADPIHFIIDKNGQLTKGASQASESASGNQWNQRFRAYELSANMSAREAARANGKIWIKDKTRDTVKGLIIFGTVWSLINIVLLVVQSVLNGVSF